MVGKERGHGIKIWFTGPDGRITWIPPCILSWLLLGAVLSIGSVSKKAESDKRTIVPSVKVIHTKQGVHVELYLVECGDTTHDGSNVG